MLQLLSPYRKRDPAKGTEEEEFVENLFDSVTCCLDESNGKTKFLEAEGIELCLIMLREGKMSKPRALRLLDHALGGPEGGACCQKLVEAAGLKAVFSSFMKKVSYHPDTLQKRRHCLMRSTARQPSHRTSPRHPSLHAAIPSRQL